MSLKLPARIALAAVLLAGLAALKLNAGPLSPSAGPVAPTYRTLLEVEPRVPVGPATTPGDADSVFVISAPGSYYLTGNVTGVASKNGIKINATNVTLDLNGFTLTGVTGSLDGIRVSGFARYGTTIRNGSVNSFGDDGVDFGNSFSYSAEKLHCAVNAGVGIVGGYNGRIVGCAARSNQSDGILAGDPSVIDSCAAVFNVGNGIRAAGGCTVINCVAEVNTASGISVSSGCTVRNNQMWNNTTIGLLVTGTDNRIESNNVSGSTTGIQIAGTGNLILTNSVTSASTAYSIVAHNRYGPIVNISASGTAAVSGASAPSTLTSTDPWANFTY